MTDRDGGPAFPWTDSPDKRETHQGMTLRDWFAGQALAGMLSAHIGDSPWPDRGPLSSVAYSYADALLAERNKSRKG